MRTSVRCICMSWGRTVVGLGAAGVLAACLGGCPQDAPDNGGSQAPPAARELEIGVIDGGTYHELSEGESVPVVRGSQGGIHIDVSLILRGFPAADEYLITQRGVLQDTGEEVSPESRLLAPFFVNGDGDRQRDGQRVFLQGTQSTVRGRQARLTFTVADFVDQNISASASVVVTFVDAPL